MAGQDLLDKRRTGARQTDDEDRVRCGVPAVGTPGKEVAGVDLFRPRDPRAGIACTVGHGLQAQGIAGGVVHEGVGVVGAVFQGLAQREIKMETMFVGEVVTRQLRAHRRDLVVAEAEGLEVGQAPVRFAETGIQRNAAAIRGDGLRLASGGFQRMAVAHPHPRVVGVFAQQRVVERDAGGVFAQPTENRGLQGTAAGIAGVVRQQDVELRQRRFRLLIAMQHQRVMLARLTEPRRQFEAALQQMQRLACPPHPHRQLRQHADRGDIGGLLVQPCPQQRFGIGETVLGQRIGGLQQARIARGMADVREIGGIRAFGIADAAQVVGQRQPGLRQFGLERQRCAQRLQGLVAAAGAGQRQAEFVMHQGGARLLPDQRLQDLQRLGRAPAQAVRSRQHQQRRRMRIDHPQDLGGLLAGQLGIAGEQARSVVQGDIKAGGGV